MPDLSDAQVHWALASVIPAGGGLFMFLLKRTFADFEGKVGVLFKQLEDAIAKGHDHEARIKVLEDRAKRSRR